MKKYDIYGVGNALLDMVYEVNEEQLQSIKVEKGIMTLVNEDQHHQLVAGLSEYKSTVACGGSAANTIITAQELGAKTYYSCSVANDTTGNLYYHDLINHQVDTNLTQTNRAEGNTGKCIVMVTPDAERSMCTYLGITDQLHKAVLDEQAIAASRYVYIEGYLVSSPVSRAAAILVRETAEKAGVKTSITLSDPFMVSAFKNELLEMIGDKVDLLFCNEQEALTFCETDDLYKAQECLKKYARQFVITRGKNGAAGFDGEKTYQSHAYNAKLVDTLGAGDTFAGAFLYAITHGHRFEDATQFANITAAHVVEKLGPRLENKELIHIRQMLLKTITL